MIHDAKTQAVRLIDVFVLGPFMVWASFQLRPPAARVVMLASGIATIAFNGRNYLQIARRTRGT